VPFSISSFVRVSMAGVQIKLRKVDGSIIKWVPSAGFDLKSKLDSVNAAALKWTDEDGIQEDITDKERLCDIAGAHPLSSSMSL